MAGLIKSDTVTEYFVSNYEAESNIKSKSNTDRTAIKLPDNIYVNINSITYRLITGFEIDINTTTYWDDATYATPSNRVGKDFYIYACVPSSGNSPDIILSDDTSAPAGYTTTNSKKIGGFHCLCVDIGTDTYAYDNADDDLDLLDIVFVSHSITKTGAGNTHWLRGYIAGDIIPFSIWDLTHRPISRPEGMVYDVNTDRWVDIYLPYWNPTTGRLESKNLATIADGTSSPAFHWYRFSQVFAKVRKNLLNQYEFVSASLGSPQGVNIAGSEKPITTTGHVATDGLRIVSNIGCEDITGVLFQWGNESGSTYATVYSNAFDANDKNVGGQEYSNIGRPVFSGNWYSGVQCGSRFSAWISPGLFLTSTYSGRGCAEPIKTSEVI